MRHIIEVNGTFHYRRRVPDELRNLVGKDYWKSSLKTADKREAEIKARALAVEHDHLISQLRSVTANGRATLLAEHVAAANEAADAAWDATVSISHDGNWIKQNDPAATAAHRKAEAVLAKLERAMLSAASLRLQVLPAGERELVDDAGGLEAFILKTQQSATRVSETKNMLALRNLMAAKKLPRLDDEKLQATLGIDSSRIAKAEGIVAKLGLAPLNHGAAEDPSNPRIKTVLEIWLKERGQRAEAVKRHRVAIQRFIELHGNVTVREIARKMVEAYKQTIADLTDHRRLPAKDRGTLTSMDGLPKVSAPTVNRHLISIKALLEFCIEKEWIGKNVARGIDAPADTRPKAMKRRSMSREERIRFLNRAIADFGEDSDRVWLIKLAAYTGSRLEEVAQLSRNNVKAIDGTWVIEIDDLEGRKLKNYSSVRNVPLHPAIRDEFLAWLEKTDRAGRDRVFMSFKQKAGRYSTALSGDMARLMDRAEITDSRVVMHSMRHGLKVAMADAGIEGEYRRLILGHMATDVHSADYEPPSIGTIAREFEKMRPLF